MAVAGVDVPQLASFCSVPETSIHSILDQPTAELVRSLLDGVSARIQEHNELKSEKVRVDVELENAVRGADSKSRALRHSLEKAQLESADVKRKLQIEGKLPSDSMSSRLLIS